MSVSQTMSRQTTIAPDASYFVVFALPVSREVESMASGGSGGNEKWRVRMSGEGEGRRG